MTNNGGGALGVGGAEDCVATEGCWLTFGIVTTAIIIRDSFISIFELLCVAQVAGIFVPT